MKTFEHVNEIWLDACEEVATEGSEHESRAGLSYETLGYAVRLLDPTNRVLTSDVRKFCPSYASAELLWYLRGQPDVKMMCAYAPQYKGFASDGTEDGVAPGYSYGWRWASNPGFLQEPRRGELRNQLEAAERLLLESPGTRQCVVTVYDSGDLIHAIEGESYDVPCTVALNFNLREGELHLGAYMRSNDVWLGLPYDVYCFTAIQEIMARKVGAELGTYCHHVGSLHAYERNMEGIIGAEVRDRYGDDRYAGLDLSEADAIRAEADAREGRLDEPACRTWAEEHCGDLLGDSVACCMHKVVPDFDARSLVGSTQLSVAIDIKEGGE